MLKAAGFLLGLTVVAMALIAWRVPPGDGRLGADLTVLAIPSGELAVSASGPVLHRRGLAPSGRDGAAQGWINVRNTAQAPRLVQLRAPADSPSLDALFHVEATAGKMVLFRGPAGGLRRWTRRSFRLAAGEERTLRLRAWLPEGVDDRYRGRFATLNLEFRPVDARNA